MLLEGAHIAFLILRGEGPALHVVNRIAFLFRRGTSHGAQKNAQRGSVYHLDEGTRCGTTSGPACVLIHVTILPATVQASGQLVILILLF